MKSLSPALLVAKKFPLDPNAPQLTAQLGSVDGRSAMEIVSPDDHRPYRLIYNNNVRDPRDGWWEWSWADASGGNVLAFCHSKAKEWTEKTPDTAKAWLPHGFYVGAPRPNRTEDNDGRVYTTAGRTYPRTGTWSKGDRMLNNNPVPGDRNQGCAGWICVQGSSATEPGGRWVPFGAI